MSSSGDSEITLEDLKMFLFYLYHSCVENQVQLIMSNNEGVCPATIPEILSNVDNNEITIEYLEGLKRFLYFLCHLCIEYQGNLAYMPPTMSNNGERPPAAVSEVLKLCAPSLDTLSGEQCSICLYEYQVNNKALIMPCNHIFHDNCLKEWLKEKNFCPLCKFELKTDDTLYEGYKKFLNQEPRDGDIA